MHIRTDTLIALVGGAIAGLVAAMAQLGRKHSRLARDVDHLRDDCFRGECNLSKRLSKLEPKIPVEPMPVVIVEPDA